MKTAHDQTSPARRAGFSLIEMIGVIAIIAILAAMVVPNVVRSIDLAAIKTEAESLRYMGEQIKTYRRDNGDLPGQGAGGTWFAELATYSDLSAVALQRNSRLNNRVFFLESAAPNTPRAILLSSMRPGLALPGAGGLGLFQGVWDWDTRDPQPPPGWPAAWTNQGQYLGIERINLRAYLPNLNLALNNNSTAAVTVSARIMHADGTNNLIVVTPGLPTVSPPFASAGETINFYLNNSGTGPVDYIHVMSSSSAAFNYDDAKGWFPP